MKLKDKRALITGADSGIGQAIAEIFAQEGADVAIVYHTDRDGAEQTRQRVEAAGRRALVMQGDVGDPASVRRMFDEAVNALGGLEIEFSGIGGIWPRSAAARLRHRANWKIDVLYTSLIGPYAPTESPYSVE